MKWEKLHRRKHTNEGGWLSELVSMEYEDEPFDCLHSYLVSFEPGTKRAMHYHKKKKEWLTIGAGNVKLVLEDIQTKEKESVLLDEDDEKQNIVYIPPKVAHVLKNIGEKKACVIAFSKTPEHPEDTKGYEMEV